MRTSRLPIAGQNLFQEIKKHCAEAEAKGKQLLKLSIGQPAGPALPSARTEAARAVQSDDEGMHAYQDNGCAIPDFARRFVQCQVKADLTRLPSDKIAFLPTPGIKPMLGLVPLACGANSGKYPRIITGITTKPGYPTPRDWCRYLGMDVSYHEIELGPQNNFRFELPRRQPDYDLIMMNYPHNPSGQVASREWLHAVCGTCELRGIRLFNDAAYAILAHTEEHSTLTDIAVNFPNLSWAEAFSASKAGNFTGWRIGAIAGSPDFIGDIATIKGNTDSGFAAPLAAGVLHAFEKDRPSIYEARQAYSWKLHRLIRCLEKRGMRLAVLPQAGFFSLWLTPRRAFGTAIENARHFNLLMIERAGIVGVHFDPYVRYAVCGPVEVMIDSIEEAFKAANVSY